MLKQIKYNKIQQQQKNRNAGNPPGRALRYGSLTTAAQKADRQIGQEDGQRVEEAGSSCRFLSYLCVSVCIPYALYSVEEPYSMLV